MSEFAGLVSFEPSGVSATCLPRLAANLDGAGAEPVRHHLTEVGAFLFRQRVLAPEDRLESQPSLGRGSGIVSMFDGRLDNRAELLAALDLTNSSEAPVPDGALVRHSYERWGEGAVPRLLGDFAWAVWNPQAGRLMLTRDHSRLRPLFYCRTDEFVAFATGYQPLLGLPGVSRTLDEATVAQFLMGAPDGSERSFYKDIQWVGSAMRVVLTADATRQDRLWEPTERPLLKLGSDAAYVEAARSVFDQAVSSRLRLAGPVVSAISGGLDSSAVAVTAARKTMPATVHGLCLVPRPGSTVSDIQGRYADERPFVGTLRDRYENLSIEYLADEAADAAIPFQRLAAPVRAPGNFLWFGHLYRRTAQLGAATFLDGGNGNNTFSAPGVDPLPELLRMRDWRALAREVVSPGSSARIVRRVFGATFSNSEKERLQGWPDFTPLHPDFAEEHCLREQYERNAVAKLHSASGGRFRRLRYFTLRSRVQMEWIAAQRRLHGVVPSDPFSDRRLIEFCLALPNDQFRRGGQGRSLARRAFADRLSPDIVSNPRKGLQDPEWHWRLSANRERLEAAMDSMERSALASRVLDIRQLRLLLHRLPIRAEDAEPDRHFYMQALEMSLHLGEFLEWIGRDAAKADSRAVP